LAFSPPKHAARNKAYKESTLSSSSRRLFVDSDDPEAEHPAAERQEKKLKVSLRSPDFAKAVLSNAEERMKKLDVTWETRRVFALKQYAHLILSRLDLSQESVVELVSKQAGVSERSLYKWLAHQRDFGEMIPEDGRGSQSMFHGLLSDLDLRSTLIGALRSLANQSKSTHTLPQQLYQYINTELRQHPAFAERAANAEAPSSSSSSKFSELKTSQEVISMRTVYVWMPLLGYTRHARKKGVYIDGHERADVKEYRNQVFLPADLEYQQYMWTFDDPGQPKPPAKTNGNKADLM
jgi:hypothetical protein